jgi:branched-chain amino acid transport system ATP-binding protein
MDELVVESLEVRYGGGELGASSVSLQVHPGQAVALLGANGAGKSSTLRGISGFLSTESGRVSAGSVRLGSRDLTQLVPHRKVVEAGVVCIPERGKIFANLTVAENLDAVGGSQSRRRRRELLDRVNALFPILLERRSQYAGSLSGGQQQMLAIGRGLMADAKVLLIDEMTLGIHDSILPTLGDAIRGITANGAAVLFAEESADFALSVADHCYIIKAGEIVADGPPALFESNEDLVAGYLG